MSYPYYVKYRHKNFDVTHYSICEDSKSLKELIDAHDKNWLFSVWQMIPLDIDEVIEVLADYA